MVPFEPGCGEPRAGSGRQCLYRAGVQWARQVSQALRWPRMQMACFQAQIRIGRGAWTKRDKHANDRGRSLKADEECRTEAGYPDQGDGRKRKRRKKARKRAGDDEVLLKRMRRVGDSDGGR